MMNRMINRILRGDRIANFSIMKKNLTKAYVPTVQSLEQLHDHVLRFEQSLDDKQLGKYKRMSNKFSKRIKRMLIKSNNLEITNQKIYPEDICNNYPKIPLQATTICGLLYRTELQILKQYSQTGNNINISTISTFLNRFMQYDLENYSYMVGHSLIGKNMNIYHLIIEKFNILEQEFSKRIFKDYNLFQSSLANKLFKKEKVYKGEYKFQINQSIINPPTIAFIVDILKCVSQFGLLSDKYLLSLQLFIKNQWKNFTLRQTAQLFQVLAISGRSIPQIDDNILQIYQAMQRNNINNTQEQALYNNQALLSYVICSKSENYYIIEGLTEVLQSLHQKVKPIHKKFTVNWYLHVLCMEILKLKYNKIVKTSISSKKDSEKYQLIFSQLTKDVKDYLIRSSINFKLSQFQILGLPTFIFPIQNSQDLYPITIFPLPPLFYNLTSINQSNSIPTYSPNGLYNLLSQCFTLQNQSEFKKSVMKSVNISKKQWMDTRTDFDDYLDSKTKGIERGPRKTRKLFNF